MKKLSIFLCLMCLTAALAVPASAAGPLEYSIDAPGDPDYGVPTSFEPVATMDGGARKNEDISKNATLIPPGFGTASADTLNTGRPSPPIWRLIPGPPPARRSTAPPPPSLFPGAQSRTPLPHPPPHPLSPLPATPRSPATSTTPPGTWGR